jgi:hypothetical protein
VGEELRHHGEPRPPAVILQNLGRHDLHHIRLIEATLQELAGSDASQ